MANNATDLEETPAGEPCAVTPPPRVAAIRWSGRLCEQLVRAVDLAIMLLAGLPLEIGATRATAIPPQSFQLAATAGLALITSYFLVHFRAYRLLRFGRVLRPIADAALAVALTLGLVEVGGLLLSPTRAEQAFMLSWAALAFAGIALTRQVERRLVAAGLRRGTLRRKVALIGATAKAEHLIGRLRAHDREMPSQIIGIYDDRNVSRRPLLVAGVPVHGGVEALCDYASIRPVDLIVIALPWHRAVEIFGLIARVQWISADVVIAMEEGAFNARAASVASVAGEPAVQVARQPLRGVHTLLKLVTDYAIALVAVVLLMPLILVCAAAIKLDSPGPILTRHARSGAGKPRFDLLKFRTISVGRADGGVLGIGRHDPRLTRAGRVLRQLRFDEIPQLFNVLRGEMSIVGPRAHAPGMLARGEEYADAVIAYAARHRIKPGITGLAQIAGVRSGMHSITKARHGVELDMTYVETWSLGLDFRIIGRTLLAGLFGLKAP